MGRQRAVRVIRARPRPLPFPLPALERRRPRAYEEWAALRRWGTLPSTERVVPGYLLRASRERAGLSQAELAKRLGCSQQAVSQAERWASNPTVELLRAWADATGARLELTLACAGFEPLPGRGAPVSNEMIDRLREGEVE